MQDNVGGELILSVKSCCQTISILLNIFTYFDHFYRSVGCTIFEMATGKPPLSDKEPMSALFHIGNNQSMPRLPSTCSDEAIELVDMCLQLLVINC